MRRSTGTRSGDGNREQPERELRQGVNGQGILTSALYGFDDWSISVSIKSAAGTKKNRTAISRRWRPATSWTLERATSSILGRATSSISGSGDFLDPGRAASSISDRATSGHRLRRFPGHRLRRLPGHRLRGLPGHRLRRLPRHRLWRFPRYRQRPQPGAGLRRGARHGPRGHAGVTACVIVPPGAPPRSPSICSITGCRCIGRRRRSGAVNATWCASAGTRHRALRSSRVGTSPSSSFTDTTGAAERRARTPTRSRLNAPM